MKTIKVDTNYFNLKDTLECGQIFRFNKSDKGYYVYSKDKRAYCYEEDDSVVIESDYPDYFFHYFDLERDYGEINRKLSGFYELKEAASSSKGIRILNQDPFEMIISFIISANNNIPRIKQIIERLCQKSGQKIDDYYAFPTRESLLKLSENDYLEIGAGYRAPYLVDAVKKADEQFVKGVLLMNADGSIARLKTIKGVGPKVADCITLFGLSKWSVFPVDTWIIKALKSDELIGAKEIREHYLNRYGEYSGLAQQYIFHYNRNKTR